MRSPLTRPSRLALLAALGALTFTTSACRSGEREGTEPAADTTMAAPAMGNTVVDVAASDDQFTTLVDLVTTAGLAETLRGAGPFTVFAPSNDAFAKLPAGTLDTLKLEKNRAQLTSILLYHVVNGGNVKAADVLGMQTLTTSGPVTVAVENGVVRLNGTATVVQTDHEASNGTVHVIDTVLMPPTTPAGTAPSGAAGAGTTGAPATL